MTAKTKLNRNQSHTINVHQADRLYLWDSPFSPACQNLTLQDNSGIDVLTIYGIDHDRLASLYTEISHALGKPPEATMHHLKQIHETIGVIIKEDEPDDEQKVDWI